MTATFTQTANIIRNGEALILFARTSLKINECAEEMNFAQERAEHILGAQLFAQLQNGDILVKRNMIGKVWEV